MSTPAHPVLRVQQFLTQNGMTPVPQLPYSSNLALSNIFFFVSLDEKVLKERCFADVEEVKQKTAEALKSIKIHEFKNYFEQWEKVSIGVLHQMENTLKVTEVQTCKSKYTIFYK